MPSQVGCICSQLSTVAWKLEAHRLLPKLSLLLFLMPHGSQHPEVQSMWLSEVKGLQTINEKVSLFTPQAQPFVLPNATWLDTQKYNQCDYPKFKAFWLLIKKIIFVINNVKIVVKCAQSTFISIIMEKWFQRLIRTITQTYLREEKVTFGS